MSFKKKFKRFRKEWFYTGVLAFLTTCLIGLILFSSFIISNAEENTTEDSSSTLPETSSNVINSTDLIITDNIVNAFPDVDITTFNFPYVDGYSDDYSNILSHNFQNVMSEDIKVSRWDSEDELWETKWCTPISLNCNGCPYILSYYPNYDEYYIVFFFNGFSLSGYDGDDYSFTTNGYSNDGNIYFAGDFVICPNNTWCLAYYLDADDLSVSGSVQQFAINFSESGRYVNLSDVNDVRQCFYRFSPSEANMIATNIPINAIKSDDLSNDFGVDCASSSFFGNTNSWTSCMTSGFNRFDGMAENGTTIINIHPLSSGTDDDSGGTDENNLVLENSDWIFRNKQYSAPYSNVINTGSVIPNGTCTFVSELNDYQIANLDNFEIVYSFSFELDVNYQNWGSNDLGPFKQTSKLLNNKKNYKASFLYQFDSHPELIQSLSSFYSAGCSHSFTYNDLFNNLNSSSGTTLVNLLNQMKELDSVEYNKFNIICTAWLDSSGTTKSSGKRTEWYNPMSKKGYTIDDSANYNPNPYVPSDEDQGEDDVQPKPNTPGPGGNVPDNTEPSTSDDGTTVTSGNGNVNVTVQNNPTFNNNVNGGSSSGSDLTNPENAGVVNFWNVFNPVNLFFGQLIKGKDASVETISDATHSNGWLELMGEIFSFLPASFWSAMGTFFVACLGIVVVAFVIRIILDLL